MYSPISFCITSVSGNPSLVELNTFYIAVHIQNSQMHKSISSDHVKFDLTVLTVLMSN